jgi:hypothetical protein
MQIPAFAGMTVKTPLPPLQKGVNSLDSSLALRMTAIFIGCLPLNPPQRGGIDGCHKKNAKHGVSTKKAGKPRLYKNHLKFKI